MKKIVFIYAAMMAFAATAFAQECDYDPQVGVIKIWKSTAPLTGNFSVSSTKKVCFAPGNLQYNSGTLENGTQKWQFAEHQYDYIGNTTGNTNITASGKANGTGVADLFGWVGASSSWTGVRQYGLTSSKTTNAVDGYGTGANENLKSDWGTLMGSGWRTLTIEEWNYLLNERDNYADLKSFIQVHGVNGRLILPDNWTVDGSALDAKPSGTISDDDWDILEEEGAVFLPQAGLREGTSIMYANSFSYYWSSSAAYSVYNGYDIDNNSTNGSPSGNRGSCSRYNGHPVRLVKDVVTP